MVTVQPLDGSFAEVYQTVWLEALRCHPEAFGASYEEESSVSVEKRAAMLNNSTPDDLVFGAVDEGLIGIGRFSRYLRPKMRHRAGISAMYVDPAARGRGVGKALLNAIIQHAKACDGLEDVALAVTVGNDTARRLYLQAGFQPYSVDPRFLKVDDCYYDIEWMILNLSEQE